MDTAVLDPTGLWGLFATIFRPWTAQDYWAAWNAHADDKNPLRYLTGC
jgi:hypothetical protein